MIRFSVNTLQSLALTILIPILMGCGSDGPDPVDIGELGDGLKVLFIGNSLTYTNDLPGLVQTMAEVAGEEMAVRVVVAGGVSLEDHWNAGTAVSTIRAAEWDIVVLQQGPSSLPENQAHLREWSLRFTEEIRRVGGTPALYMVWPEEARLEAFDAVSQAYSAAANAVNGLLLPVGEAWRVAWEMDESLDFYGPDRFHPSQLGSVLGAFVFFQQLFQRSPLGLPEHMEPTTSGLPTINLDPDVARTLQEAAALANARFGGG